MDGDKTSVFHDVDGSVSEYPGSYLIKEDNWLIKHPDCIDVPDWRGSICSGHYAQVKLLTLQFCNHFILILILLALYILTFRNWLSSGCSGLTACVSRWFWSWGYCAFVQMLWPSLLTETNFTWSPVKTPWALTALYSQMYWFPGRGRLFSLV